MKEFTSKIQAQFELMCQTGKLFRSKMTGNEVWDLYIASFDHDPIFRDPNSSTHNCNHCKNFIRRYGNIVSVDENFNITTIFDVEISGEFSPVATALSNALKSQSISGVFFETFEELNSLPYESCSKSNSVFRLGVDKNVKRYTKEEAEKFGVVKPNEVKTFNHLHLNIPALFVDKSGKSIEAIMGEFRDSAIVFQRAMETISLDTLNLVKDLINQGSLLDGQTHLYKIEQIIPLKKEYDLLSASVKENWCWVKSYKLPFAKFRNELIGTLCSELSEGEELNKACESWNKRVDPANYMKATAPITKKQIEEAKLFVEQNGYEESFNRRFATIEDIKVSEILHSNIGKSEIKKISVFDGVKSTSTRHKRSEFDGIEEISIDKFMKDVLPSCTSVEAFLKNSHERHMVSLTTSVANGSSKPMFKWDNNYSWTFNGNLAGRSMMKEAVKAAGGKIDGVLRFSISWNEDGKSIVDFDLHGHEPIGGRTIKYDTSFRKDRGGLRTSFSGQLDVDMINPLGLGVENIVWDNLNKMKNGSYTMKIHNFNGGQNTGFKAEVEFDGETYCYEKLGNIRGTVDIATVTLKDGVFSIEHHIPENSVSSKEFYGLETNNFHKVNLVCLSPNHWGNNSTGNKHYFFMLDGAKSPVSIRSFHVENLNSDLTRHRKVMEVLGTSTMIEPAEKQLSGLGFNSTVRDELIVRLSGSHKRVVKIKF